LVIERSRNAEKFQKQMPKPLLAYMYILECANGTFYTGSTIDIDKRLAQHHAGEGANYTKKHRPVKLVYVEFFQNIEDAFNREKQVQGWSRKKKLALISGEYNKLSSLAECSNNSHYKFKDND
jgi:putative endonuclease